MIAANSLQYLIERVSLYDDTTAYKELFLKYYSRLLHFSYSITHSKETSEEIISDIFLQIWNKRKTLTGIQNFHLYLYVSTKNLSINRLRKLKKEKVFSLDEVIVEFKSIYYDPEQLLITSEMYKRIFQAIQALPPRCQLIFKLIKEDHLSYKEVAELLGLSVKTIENQMTIALKKISQSIRFDIKRTISF
jgi:RNA polymerase sigma-70 factor (ECF subfamily)